ncbi:hypothetical protein AMATHDRAFT_151764 [Amanita thiersii Skay4041]|uniref:Pentafunctional AROM polypeptide n=1 Tax=Amanita thiersii Skay4041 TaxID=703135 RepID=A0A2A9NIT1_9AGAR|nr:hypothetical protein AMATHDRAFT_151764 [Amanita thiersii Skay4041]
MPATDVFKVSILGKDSIHCGFHLIPYIAHTVITTLPSSTYVLVTDTNVAKYHLTNFEKEFEAAITNLGSSSRFLSHVIPPGETSKSREGKASIEDFLLFSKCTRDTVILALGGGVIGDLVGFVSATFMRGVRFCQIPTTLLAMVDSSVGGKTAIDTPHGKNLVGAFWQPEYIFIDAAFLETLPTREFSNGMAEVVKTAAIWNADEFASLESHSTEIFTAIHTPSTNNAGRTKLTRTSAQDLLLSVIVGSISVKAHIVTIDERETGLRNLVNFGHSIGHAIEAVLTPAILHGECISIGMILEAELARQMGILSQVAVGRLTRCLKAYNLPVTMTDPRIATLSAAKLLTVERLLDIMKIDKKNSGTDKKIVILSKIGGTYEQKATVVPDAQIAKVLAAAAKVVSGIPSHNPVKLSTPGSKSISNRALVLAALGKGTCRLRNLLHSDDTQVMMTALDELKGAKFSWEDNGETLVVQGGEGSLTVPRKGKELYLGNAGTAARFLTSVCALVQKSPNDNAGTTVITGNARMKQRPIGPLVTALRDNGSKIGYLESEGCLPLSIPPESLVGGTIQLAASVSSQYVSSILLCAPYARNSVTLELVGGQVISQPYIDMTIAMMRTFGIDVIRRQDPATGKQLDIYDIPKGVYINPPDYSIESDASSATYPLAIAAITGTTCTISNIGCASIQGDAKFAREVLERMGCCVKQTATATTVIGPPIGQLKAIEEVDMEEMTDAFLTATALAAVAHGKTRIIGIANQRVKECNRIRAMIDELAKFGVATKELDDGLEIIGRPIDQLKRGVSVHCYDDHRVAMAFSVLGAVIQNTTLEEKRCVEKTWPNWWDDLQNKIGLDVEGVDLVQAAAEVAARKPWFNPDASVFLIGMRGSGKTFTGELAAQALSWTCLDADTYFEVKYRKGVRQYVKDNGWTAFRDAEVNILKELMEDNGTKHVISLGGGIVETPEGRKMLKEWIGPVVHVVRDVDEVLTYLSTETSRPAYGEPTLNVYDRREPWFRECSTHEFFNYVHKSQSNTTLKGARNEVVRYFRHITGQEPNRAPNISAGRRSYFLSLTFPDIRPALSQIEELTEGVDAIEVRADLLRPADAKEPVGKYIPPALYVSQQIATLRRVTSLPLVYTIRTVSQGGAFPDTATSEALTLLNLALRLGIEYIDVEISLPEKPVREFLMRKRCAQIIASWHDWSGNMNWDGAVVKEKYAIADDIGDIIKIVGKANTIQDNFLLHDFVNKAQSKPNAKPVLAINMGSEGQMSRILNATFSPVTSPLLPVKAAPGQLSFRQIQIALNLLGMLPPQHFYLFGNPIKHSMSPTLHNTAFDILGLPHNYSVFETESIDDELKALLVAPDFGGASVTIPYKIEIMSLLDELTPSAKLMGAVNTIIPVHTESGRKLIGDNTDWIGIRESIISNLPTTPVQAGLVIGAGGTARAAIYALHRLGVKDIYLFNRTRANALKLAQSFTEVEVTVLDSITQWPEGRPTPNAIVGTIPASATTLAEGTPGLLLSSKLYEYQDGPAVVVDMAYKPAETPLLKLAKEAGSNWFTVPGVEVLLEQGYVQFELWTGRRCPKSKVARVVREKYNATA